jgi:hypothetical protein
MVPPGDTPQECIRKGYGFGTPPSAAIAAATPPNLGGDTRSNTSSQLSAARFLYGARFLINE